MTSNDANVPTPQELIKSFKVQAAIAREERAKTDALFLSIGEGVIATDENGKIIRVNQRAIDLLGYPRREMIGKWFPKKIRAVTESGKPIRNIDRPISRSFVNGETIKEKMYYVRKDGSHMPVHVTISPIMLRNKPIGAIEIFRDITLENEMDKLKADFISLASHQLRTPLAAVQTYTNMFLQGYIGEVTEVQASFLNTILDASERMNDLISTLLNITRIEAGNLLINTEETDLNMLARNVMSELDSLAKEKNIKMTYQPTDDPLIVDSDPSLIREVVINLLTNAVKYTPEGGDVTIRLTKEGHTAVVEVIDSGFGIPLGEQDRIFTKFYRATNILKRDTTGTGLGLYLVKNIAERLGGDLMFTSFENQGTTFTFTLPSYDTVVPAKISI
ncbi:MAG: hypothetical protein JWM37_264 [Candidatus Saccharibacteria bacterium]|nr:hypothetical protein [Candidatus Saccharibacteria bacterium]